jgi:hypothetical protein
MNDLSIVPLPSQHTEKSDLIPSVLPQGSALLIAPSNSGKSTYLTNLILRHRYGYTFWFSTIFVFSPTLQMDSTWDLVHEYTQGKVRYKGKMRQTANIVTDSAFSLEKVSAILDAQDSLRPEQRKRCLVILDDVADALPRGGNDVLERLFFRGRHARVWCWLSSQAYRRVPRNIRLNSPYYVVWRVRAVELHVLADELAVESKEEFVRIYHEATSARFGFLTIDTKKDLASRYSKSFTPITSQLLADQKN